MKATSPGFLFAYALSVVSSLLMLAPLIIEQGPAWGWSLDIVGLTWLPLLLLYEALAEGITRARQSCRRAEHSEIDLVTRTISQTMKQLIYPLRLRAIKRSYKEHLPKYDPVTGAKIKWKLKIKKIGYEYDPETGRSVNGQIRIWIKGGSNFFDWVTKRVYNEYEYGRLLHDRSRLPPHTLPVRHIGVAAEQLDWQE